ncbi:MAG: hypothetical protein HYU28_10180 [Actinobacteria bacterium]|nr:hypothetical protein [Actinomycetota bacterium]
MRKLPLTILTFGLAIHGPAALADPGGTSETENQVNCGTPDVGVPGPSGWAVSARFPRGEQGSANSLVLCSDDDLGPDGRIIVGNTDDGGGQFCLDGDATNPEQTSGWACARGTADPEWNGIRCQWRDDPATPGDDTNSQTAPGSSHECPNAF